jgi:hypothetical protein
MLSFERTNLRKTKSLKDYPAAEVKWVHAPCRPQNSCRRHACHHSEESLDRA